MQNPKTVVLGEASEESDSEEITLDDECEPSRYTDGAGTTRPEISQQMQPNIGVNRQQEKSEATGPLGGLSSIFASLGSSSSRLSRIANYTPYNLIASTIGGQTQQTTVNKTTTEGDPNHSPRDNKSETENQMPLLHRSLLVKNRQLQASLVHLYKHPLQAASKNLYTINQHLVNDQRLIQEICNAMVKIQREQNNLDIQINMIAD